MGQKNLRELFTLYPLGCESFGAEWLRRWEALGELLQKQVQIDFFVAEAPSRTYWAPLFGTINPATVAECIIAAATDWTGASRRVVLMDGTIVKEWN